MALQISGRKWILGEQWHSDLKKISFNALLVTLKTWKIKDLNVKE